MTHYASSDIEREASLLVTLARFLHLDLQLGVVHSPREELPEGDVALLVAVHALEYLVALLLRARRGRQAENPGNFCGLIQQGVQLVPRDGPLAVHVSLDEDGQEEFVEGRKGTGVGVVESVLQIVEDVRDLKIRADSCTTQ